MVAYPPQNQEDVVMSNKVIAPLLDDLTDVYFSELSSPFSNDSLSFVRDLSEHLLNYSGADSAEIKSLGFWCRPNKVNQLRESYLLRNKGFICRPKGTVFQIAPGNVDTLFLYSALLAILLGNRAVVRISSKKNQQHNPLFRILNLVLSDQKHLSVAKRFRVFSCDHDSQWIKEASSKCDVRVIWGSDQTIQSVRKIPIPANAKELSFADRISLSLINADELCRHKKMEDLFLTFSRDIFTYSQQACSSPRGIIWQGSKESVRAAQAKFWPEFSAWIVKHRADDLNDAQLISRITALQSMSIFSSVRIIKDETNNLLVRLDADEINYESLEYHSGNGIILETYIESISDLNACLSSKLQTLSFWGYQRDTLLQFIDGNNLDAIDRVVKIGGALEFESTWDGYDLMSEFTRFLK